MSGENVNFWCIAANCHQSCPVRTRLLETEYLHSGGDITVSSQSGAYPVITRPVCFYSPSGKMKVSASTLIMIVLFTHHDGVASSFVMWIVG